MALERAIALTACAVGVVLVTTALLPGCRDDSETRVAEACGPQNSSLGIAGVEFINDREAVRFAYVGAEPCSFAATTHKGRTYVELRTETPIEEHERTVTGCAEGTLDFEPETESVPGTEAPPVAIYTRRKLIAAAQVEALLSAARSCIRVPARRPAFIID